MTAAETLRAALDAAPEGLHVAEDGYGDLEVWDKNEQTVIYAPGAGDTMRLVGLLLAAAPHLADWMECQGTDADRDLHLRDLRQAITEAGESL